MSGTTNLCAWIESIYNLRWQSWRIRHMWRILLLLPLEIRNRLLHATCTKKTGIVKQQYHRCLCLSKKKKDIFSTFMHRSNEPSVSKTLRMFPNFRAFFFKITFQSEKTKQRFPLDISFRLRFWSLFSNFCIDPLHFGKTSSFMTVNAGVGVKRWNNSDASLQTYAGNNLDEKFLREIGRKKVFRIRKRNWNYWYS